MKYDVFNYSNKIIGQVEASEAIEAWSKARSEFDGQNILDVRQVTDRSKEVSELLDRLLFPILDFEAERLNRSGASRKHAEYTLEGKARTWLVEHAGYISRELFDYAEGEAMSMVDDAITSRTWQG